MRYGNGKGLWGGQALTPGEPPACKGLEEAVFGAIWGSARLSQAFMRPGVPGLPSMTVPAMKLAMSPALKLCRNGRMLPADGSRVPAVALLLINIGALLINIALLLTNKGPLLVNKRLLFLHNAPLLVNNGLMLINKTPVFPAFQGARAVWGGGGSACVFRGIPWLLAQGD